MSNTELNAADHTLVEIVKALADQYYNYTGQRPNQVKLGFHLVKSFYPHVPLNYLRGASVAGLPLTVAVDRNWIIEVSRG